MKKYILILLMVIGNMVYSQTPWVEMDGYHDIPVDKGFVLGFSGTITISKEKDKTTIDTNKRISLDLYFDLIDKKVVFHNYYEDTFTNVKVTKIKKTILNERRGNFIIKGKKGNERYKIVVGLYDVKTYDPKQSLIVYINNRKNKSKKTIYSLYYTNFTHRTNKTDED